MFGILLGGLFTFLFGGMLLILILGAQRIESELKEREHEAGKIRAQAARIPRFFVVTQPARQPVAGIDGALASQVQQYLEEEQLLADEFVMQPSVENLYRESSSRLMWH